ncbi:MAG: TetR/AcrR family transcriptional regulator [Psychromonas sp.]|nr:TetR/AcrR family transcriptional regulator [Alteromonadales bacterium]MCP5076469.1 TetR/AcrR family transcriptional regulator [Psychromonas sp.]
MTVTKREIKTAQNKQTILNSLLARMHNEAFDKIKISDLCSDANISQASFYNYFPQKSDILVYYIQLWAVEMHWQILIERELTGLVAIDTLFNLTAQICASQPQLMAEIVAFQAKSLKIIKVTPLSKADKLVAYPNYQGIDTMVVEDLPALLSINIQQAIDAKELPLNSDISTLIVSLSSIFFSIPIMFNQSPLAEIQAAYQQQLSLFRLGAVNKFTS